MTARFSIAFWLIVIAQVLVLAAMVGFSEQIKQTGERIVLQTVPVDPRSLLQGDYAILNYEIAIPGRIENANPLLTSDLQRYSTVYVTLEQQGEIWQATGYHIARPRPGELFIAGHPADGAGRLDFGIGTYFVPEGTGHIVENARDVKVRVFIDRDGDAVIDDVLVDGVPFLEAVESQR